MSNKEDINKYIPFQSFSDIILFDGKGYEKSIGFDHNFLNDIPPDIEKMIAGNINIENIPILKDTDYIIDLSGSLENEEGKKDLQKINNFLKIFKTYED